MLIEQIVLLMCCSQESEKSEFIKDLLVMLGDDKCREIYYKLKNQLPLLGD